MKLGKPYQDGGQWWQDVEEWGECDRVPAGALAWDVSRKEWFQSNRVGFTPTMGIKYRILCEPPAEEWKCPEGWRVLADDEMTWDGDRWTHSAEGRPYTIDEIEALEGNIPPFDTAKNEVNKWASGHGHIIRRIEEPKAEPEYLYAAGFIDQNEIVHVGATQDEGKAIDDAKNSSKGSSARWVVLRLEIIGDVQPAKYVPRDQSAK